jgi:hypothetical protein
MQMYFYTKKEKKMKTSKKINLVLLLIAAFAAGLFAQNAPIDFEAGGYGADWTWAVFENQTNPPLEIIDNPDASGVNTSATAAKFTALQAGQPWAGCESLHGTDIGLFNLDTSNCVIKIMVYKPIASDVGIKLVKPDSWSMGEIKISNTLINQWEELTFDFTAQITDGYDQIVIFPDFDLAGRTQDNICYFDNISFHSQGDPPEGPTVAAPTPTAPEENVISLFSNAYTNVTVDTWSADWDMADVADVQIEGNDTKLYTNLNYAGIEFTSQTIDASSMTHFNLDVWTPDVTSGSSVFKVKLVDFGADGAYDGGDDSEHELTFDANTMETEAWVSLDIPLSQFSGLTETGHLAQLIISGDPNTVYVDNVYFYNSNADADDAFGSITSPFILGSNYPNPFNPTTTISFSLETSADVTLSVYDVKGRLVDTLIKGTLSPNSYNQVWNAENAASGIYFYKLEVNGQEIDTKRMVLVK